MTVPHPPGLILNCTVPGVTCESLTDTFNKDKVTDIINEVQIIVTMVHTQHYRHTAIRSTCMNTKINCEDI